MNTLLDSSILIDCLRGHADAESLLASQAAHEPPHTHLVVAAELLAGARNKAELAMIDSFLDTLHVVAPIEADGVIALDLFRRFRLSHGVDWPDCQIAATATRLGLEVITQNLKHFSIFPSVCVRRGY